MLSFDARTVVLVACLTVSLLFVSLLALHRSLTLVLPGLREGVIAMFGWACGSGLILARGSIPYGLSIGFGNVLMTVGIWFMFVGLHYSVRGPLERKTWIWVVAIVGSAATVSLALSGNYPAFLTFITVYNGMLYGVCSIFTGRAKPFGFALGITALALGLAATVSLIRALTLVVGIDVAAQAFDLCYLQRWYFSLLALAILSTSMGFSLITYERLNKLLAATNSSLESEVSLRTVELKQEIVRKLALERQLATSAEAERRRIGIELHDDLGQRLTGISLIAEVLSRELLKASQHLSGHADVIQRSASEAIVQVRELAHGLIPVAPDPEGFGEALAQLAKASSVQGFNCKFDYDEPVDIKNPDVAANLFRIAQEAVSNAIRHAKARNITLRLEEVAGKVVLSVVDNGSGFIWPQTQTQTQTENGRGMGIMEFRASLIHYRLDVNSVPGHGTTIKAMEC